jgi:hypothetical protein
MQVAFPAQTRGKIRVWFWGHVSGKMAALSLQARNREENATLVTILALQGGLVDSLV